MTKVLSNKDKINIIDRFGAAKDKPDFNEKYILEEERTFDEPGFIVVESTYLDVKTRAVIKRQVRHCINYLYSQACKDAIEKRKKWKKFGAGIDDTSHLNNANIVDPVFMEWNPEIFKSRKTKAYMNDYFNDYENGTHKEEIHYQENKCFGDNMPDLLKQYLDIKERKELKNKLRKELDIVMNNSVNNINNDYSTPGKEDDNSTVPGLFKVNKSGKSSTDNSGYVAPHLRNKNEQNSSTETNNKVKYDSVKVSNTDHIKIKSRVKNKEVDKTCIRVLNIPSDANFQSILSTMKPILGRIYFKIKTLNDKKTGKIRDFCFLNFKDELNGEKAFDILTSNKIRIGYSVLNFEWGIKRN